jgi:hypothetical protein
MSGQSYAGPPADPTTATSVPTTGPQPGVSRRAVLRRAAGAGAAGLAAAAVAGTAGPALAAATPASSRRQAARTANEAEAEAGAAGPVVVHLRDARSGEMDVFAGTSHTRLRDPELAARLARAAR